MNLTWHIVKNDVRRLWLPLALWGFMVVVSAAGDMVQLSPDLRMTHW